jgi:hypothetical protein
MRVVYEGPHEAVEVPDLAPFVGTDEFPDLGLVIERGVPTDVPDEIGKALLDQDTWRAGPTNKQPARAGKDEPARPVKDGER